MADVRALLAAERQSRRILHPHLTYSKSGALTCNVCNLNVKSEQLWPGHLKSANHRKNAANVQEHSTKTLKRKLDDVEEKTPEPRDYEVDSRKKPKSQLDALSEHEATSPDAEVPKLMPEVPGEEDDANGHLSIEQSLPETTNTAAVAEPVSTVDEDEWAAFERDVAPLAQPDYSAAVITAAPVTAAELAAQEEAERRRNRENEADDEKEDEGRRMEDEFEVMEEMEDRFKKLKEKREALRTRVHTTDQTDVLQPEEDVAEVEETQITTTVDDKEEEDDEEDEDDWYGR